MKLFLAFLVCNLTWAVDIKKSVREEYEYLLSKKYSFLPHKGTYLLPVSYNHSPNNKVYEVLTEQEDLKSRGAYNREIEAEYQVSFQFLISRTTLGLGHSLFMAYTQQSWWQVYNQNWSRQFRETNYNPEIFLRKILGKNFNIFGLEMATYDFGYMHQSNGQIQELSRSWDRLFFRTIFVFKKLIITPTIWHRIPGADSLDENPDIERYLGYAELKFDYLSGKNRFGLRVIPGTRHAGFEISHSYPLSEGVRFFTKINYGYGMSLIDYNYKTERIGIGFTLTDLLSNISN